MDAQGIVKPKIAFVHSNNNDVGGSDIAMWRLVVAAKKHGYDVLVVLSKPTSITSRYYDEKISVRFVAQPRLSRKSNPLVHIKWGFNVFVSTWNLWKLFRNEKTDLVFANDVNEIAAAVAAWANNRPCLTRLRFFLNSPFLIKKLYLFGLSFFSAKILCISDAVKSYNFPGCSGNKVMTLYDWYSPPSTPKEKSGAITNLLQKLGISTGDQLILMPGRLEPWKGQSVLVEAAPLILKNIPRAKILFVGAIVKGSGRERYSEILEGRVQSLGLKGKVFFNDHVEQIEELFFRSSVIVHCSVKDEPFGLTVLEALGLGIPLVTTNAGGPLEIVGSPPAALLCTPGDSQDLSDKVVKILTDQNLRETLVKRGKLRSMSFEEGPLWSQFEAIVSSHSRSCPEKVEAVM